MKERDYIPKYSLEDVHPCGLTNDQLGEVVRLVYNEWVREQQENQNTHRTISWEKLKQTRPEYADCDIRMGRTIADIVWKIYAL